MLTPKDIETVEFKKAALGYSPDEVNTFLDKVIFDYESLLKENTRLNERIKLLEENIQYYKDLEETIKNSVVLAEKMSEETKNTANTSAEQIIKQAQLKGSEIIQDANKKLYNIEYDVMRAKSHYDSIRAKIKLLLNTELEVLENSEKDFNDDDDEKDQ